MKNIFIKSALLLFIGFLLNGCGPQKPDKITGYVDPFIGTGGHGHTFPGASMPFGMVQLSPDTRTDNWDACGGYYYTDPTIMGFSHTHLSGTGGLDYGDILFMPTVGKIQVEPGAEDKPDEGYRSRYSHDNETASPGYYSVKLDDYNVKVELTSTVRAGMQRYTFPQSDKANIILDLRRGAATEALNDTDLVVKFVSDSEIVGKRISHGWARNQYLYFDAKFSRPFKSFGIAVDNKMNEGMKEAEGKDLKGYMSYDTKEGETVLVKVGISAVSIEGAKKNLEAEMPGWDFEAVRKNADDAWVKALSKIQVEGGTLEQNKVFYTALYHSLLCPNIYTDVDGQYRGMDLKVHTAKDFTNYTVYSLWDTFRAEHPLFTIIDQKRTLDFIKDLLVKYEEGGILPIWPLAGNYTGTMIGYHAVPVIVDAYNKGIRNFDVQKAYEAMKYSATRDHLGLKSYKDLGYVAADKEHESVSKTLEYAYDDWCIAQMSKSLDDDMDYDTFSKRAENYKNLFDASTGFMRGKKADGSWVVPFDPYAVTRDFTEANSWQYTLFAPQDVNGLINLFGGDQKFIDKIDKLFTTESKLTGHEQSDISGLVGQYAHGNEPSHHMAYLYNYAGAPWKTQQRVRYLMDNLYTDKPDGLAGNEDCGQMSAWYVLSAMGFYSVTPGEPQYVIGTPLFDKVTINLENGKKFVVKANNVSGDNFYIQSAKLNGKDYGKTYITQNDIMNGGEINFEMGSSPNKKWGAEKVDRPYSFSKGLQVSVPYTKPVGRTFVENLKVELGCLTDGAEIHYTINGSEPAKTSAKASGEITVNKTMTIKAKAFKDGYKDSPLLVSKFKKANYKAAVNPGNVTSGVDYSYYEGAVSTTKQLAKMKPEKSGVMSNISIAGANIEDHFGYKFTGYIKVPKDGMYTFYTKSDDGSVLFVDNEEVVGNDGSHAPQLNSGSIALRAGYHPFKLLYFEDYEGQELEAGYVNDKAENVSFNNSSMLFRKK